MENSGTKLRQIGVLLLTLGAAVFGTGAIESLLLPLFHPHTIRGILLRETFLSAAVACLLGFVIQRCWKQEAAKWVWTIGFAIYAACMVPLASSPRHLWFQLSGSACAIGQAEACDEWVSITPVFLRTVFYSAGAWLCWYFGASGRSEIVGAVIADFRNPFLPSNPEDSTSKDSAD